jgi:transglutaminase-like putative cysteine protease
MRLRIAHSLVCRYDPPATGAIQVLRLTPRNHEGQYVVRWRIDVAPDVRLAAHEDALGRRGHRPIRRNGSRGERRRTARPTAWLAGAA